MIYEDITWKIQECMEVGQVNVEIYHTPLIPDDIETVIIKDLSIALTTSNMAEKFNCVEVDLDKYINKEAIEKYEKDIKEDKRIFDSLIQIAINDFAAAKKNHDGIEE